MPRDPLNGLRSRQVVLLEHDPAIPKLFDGDLDVRMYISGSTRGAASDSCGPTTRGWARRRIGAMFAKHPRRTLLVVLLFVAVAGFIGGPLAGRLSSSGGFVAPGADSQVAVDRLHAATGRDA